MLRPFRRRRRVIGQDAAAETVARAIRRSRVGLGDPRRAVQSMVEDPAAELLLAGEAGGGVTLLADAAGERLVLRAEK